MQYSKNVISLIEFLIFLNFLNEDKKNMNSDNNIASKNNMKLLLRDCESLC